MTGDGLKSGYAFLSGNTAPETLDYGPGKAEEILMSSDRKTIVFKRSRYNEPPVICRMNINTREIKRVYQSNESLLKYDLGRDKLLNFSAGKAGSLSGALICPAHFDPERKYPMIVWIYEKNSRQINSFMPPSDYEYAGFDILRYVTNGYFVLLPDIEYTVSKPGISALNTVTGYAGTEHYDNMYCYLQT